MKEKILQILKEGIYHDDIKVPEMVAMAEKIYYLINNGEEYFCSEEDTNCKLELRGKCTSLGDCNHKLASH